MKKINLNLSNMRRLWIYYRMCVYMKNDTKRKEENLYIQSVSPINIFIISKVYFLYVGFLFIHAISVSNRKNKYYICKRNDLSIRLHLR